MSRFGLRPEPAGGDLAALTDPPDWDAVFGQGGALELEIGSGAGGFALTYAATFPERRLVAFEWRKKFAREVDFRARKRELNNLKMIEGDARFLVPRLFAKGSLDVIHLQFPDPWWKRAHRKRAVLNPEFSTLLLSLMKPGGMFDLRTDVQDRAVDMLATLEAAGFVNPLGEGQFHPYDPEEVLSTREKRYVTSGEPVYRARLRKPGGDTGSADSSSGATTSTDAGGTSS